MTNYTPTTADVGAYVRARTKDRFGNEAGTFNADTRPTGDDVDVLISQALQTVRAKLGTANVPDDAVDLAKATVALRAAMLVELTFFPEQVKSGKSPYDQMAALFKDQLDATTMAIATEDDGTVAGDMSPTHSFPDDAGGLVGWNTFL